MLALRWIAVALLAGLAFGAVVYLLDMRRAYARIAAPTQLVATPVGVN